MVLGQGKNLCIVCRAGALLLPHFGILGM